MLKTGNCDTLVGLPAEDLVERLCGQLSPSAVDVGEGSIRVFEGDWRNQKVMICAFDASRDHGSIGRLEAEQLVRAMRILEPGAALIVLMNTSGILVTDSTYGIASLRRVLREAEEARIRGVRMLAVIVKQAFGGASMLAALCERRIINDDCLFAMSGPKLIEQTVGRGEFDARDRRLVKQILGGGARASTSSGFICVADCVSAYHAAILKWLEGQVSQPVTTAGLVAWGKCLTLRLAPPKEQFKPSPAAANGISSATFDILDTLDGAGYDLHRIESIVVARPKSVSNLMVYALITPDGCGFRDAVALGLELLDLEKRLTQGGQVVIVVEAESHSSTVFDEGLVLSEALAFLALSLRWLASRCGVYVRVVVSGFGGGGIQGALGSAANAVCLSSGARLRVLPKAAMQALNKSEDRESGSIAMAISAGAVDAEFVDRRKKEAAYVRQ
jgi:hypothetical protein